MKTSHITILTISTVSFVAILFLVTIVSIPHNVNNFSSKNYTEKTENIVQPISEAPLCVSHIENQTIDAGNLGDFSCPAPEFYTQTKILKINGFYGVYHNSADDRTDIYVLEPGHQGTVTYTISGHAIRYEGSKPAGLVIKNQTEISWKTSFIHHQVVTMPQTVKITYSGGPNGSKIPYYWVCHNATNAYPNGGMVCYGGPNIEPVPTGTITLDTMQYSHPGIDVTYQHPSEIISDNETVTVNAIVSSTSDAPTGTYWILLSPGQCNGGQILLLEVTKCGDSR